MSVKFVGSYGLKLSKLLQSGQLLPKQLTMHMKTIVIKYFMEEQSEFTNTEISELVGLDFNQVRYIKSKLLKAAAIEIEAIDVKLVAASLAMKKRELQRRAIDAHDYGLAWKIETDYIEKLQGLGFVYKAPQEIKVDTTVRSMTLIGRVEEYIERHGVQTVGEFARTVGMLGPGDGGDGGDGKVPGAMDVAGLPRDPEKRD